MAGMISGLLVSVGSIFAQEVYPIEMLSQKTMEEFSPDLVEEPTAIPTENPPPELSDAPNEESPLMPQLVTSVPLTPVLLDPKGTIPEQKPKFTWKPAASATSYKLRIYRADNTLAYSKKISSSVCTATKCAFRIGTSLAYGNYKWKVAAGNSEGYGPYSVPHKFTISKKGFNSPFNGSAAGWKRVSGRAWGIQDDAYYYTKGQADKWSATRYQTYYYSFDYSAQVKRIGGVSGGYYPGSYLAVRMGRKVNVSTNSWYPGYIFGYANDGYFNISKYNTDGSITAIQDWTYSDAIVKNGWNTLRVVGNGKDFEFYINGTLVKSFRSVSFKGGYVGFEMYKIGTTSTRFLVNWAKLSLLPSKYSVFEVTNFKEETLNPAVMSSGNTGNPESHLAD